MPFLFGLHDEEGAGVVPGDGWCLALVSLSDNAGGKDYTAIRSDVNWIHRINWGYGRTGTIPIPSQDDEYLQRLTRFLRNSTGVTRIIIGNEPNHEQERPNGTLITPQRYFQFYNKVYAAIKSLGVKVSPAPIAPYHAAPMDCMEYWKLMLDGITDAEFLVGHAYVRGTGGGEIYNETRMQAPLLGQYYSFYTYRDQLSRIPSRFRSLPFHLTEFCPVDGWEDRNTGLIKNAYSEINWWNQLPQSQKIHSLHPYRYPKYDKWAMEGKGNLMDDYYEATRYAFHSPQEGQGSTKQHVLSLPSVKAPKTQPEPSTTFEREIDERATKRGTVIQETSNAVWKVKTLRWYDEQEADAIGPDHHLLLDVIDEQGKRIQGAQLVVSWQNGFDRKTIDKTDPLWGADFPLNPARNGYSVSVGNGELSELVTGIGMGQDTPDGFNAGIHTSTRVVFQKVVELPVSTPVISLSYPVAGGFEGEISQVFGVNGEYYSRFKVSGVPLKGHNGVDFAVPEGTGVFSVDDGRVIEDGIDPSGYGIYLKILHSWGESLYAHLSQRLTVFGQTVRKGQLIAESGNTGNSTGPHLHFGIRVNPYIRTDGWGGYVDPIPYLKRTSRTAIPNYLEVVAAIREAADRTSLDFRLLLSLAWAESSFRPQISDGLYQIGDDAWEDHSDGLPLSEKNNPNYNALVGAKYLKFLLVFFKNDLDKALIAWNYGIGNVVNNEKPPAITLEFVNKVKHGRDLLRAVGYD